MKVPDGQKIPERPVRDQVEWVLIHRNPMLNRMEIRDVHGVRTEST